jgi:DNA-binding NarL/FixJ family response regulator
MRVMTAPQSAAARSAHAGHRRRVLLVSDSAETRERLEALVVVDATLELLPPLTESSGWGTAEQLAAAPGADCPPIVVVDVESGTEEALIGYFSSLEASPVVIVLVEEADREWVWGLLSQGASAVLAASAPVEELVAAINAATHGLVVLSSGLTGVIGATGADEVAGSAAGLTPEPLTPRERAVLEMLAAGLANKELARQLAVSEHTVKYHLSSIFGKLGATSRTEAVMKALRHGLIVL